MPRNESITGELRTDILEGHFEPGQRLIELSLTKQYDCGRLAVRTALLELAAEGLVDREANRGARVRDVSLAEAIQITEARAALESLIAAEAARRVDDGHREVLRAIGQDMVAAVKAGDLAAYSVLNSALHGVIREMSEHWVSTNLVARLRNRGAQHRFRISSVPGRAEESLEQHLEIIEAIAAEDCDRAARLMAEHLTSVVGVLKAWPEAPDPTSD